MVESLDQEPEQNENIEASAHRIDGIESDIDDWLYVPVERLKIFIEGSIQSGTQWAVFEPNGEPLWAELRMHIGAFMQTLFERGALRGSRAEEAYFVKCDAEINTALSIATGVVNIVVGFAPLVPAEFVVIQIQQWLTPCETGNC